MEIACGKVDIDATSAELIRLGSNAVFRLNGKVIVRIARDKGRFTDAQRQVDVARWLAAEDYPANRALDVQQPVDAVGYPATFWVSVSEKEEYATVAQVASIIRDLHELQLPQSLKLEHYRPFAEMAERLAGARSLSNDDSAFIRERIEELSNQYDKLRFPLPEGQIHGDANIGNVILSRDGHPCLIDLDNFSIGPREWDLVQTALFYERFGWHTADEYRDFVNVYGFDIMAWTGYETLASYREIAMTLWLAANDSEEAAAEVHKRVNAIKTGGDRRDWSAF
nr:aminoglycoside phosphotransferase family protein [Amycolatopsis lexingtonensis]